MKFIEYNLCNNEGKSNCVIRSLCKIYNLSYDDVYNELCDIKNQLNVSNYNDIEVFESFMKKRNTISIDYGKDKKIKELDLELGSYIILCWNKKDFYHMVSIIDNTLYDKNNSSIELYVISIYKKGE